VVGDPRYGNKKSNREFAEFAEKRMYLHAAEIAFPGLADGPQPADLCFAADQPASWQQMMSQANA
jgi:23S rRNA-/tRNA-specific pseudouridylate synthase